MTVEIYLLHHLIINMSIFRIRLSLLLLLLLKSNFSW